MAIDGPTIDEPHLIENRFLASRVPVAISWKGRHKPCIIW